MTKFIWFDDQVIRVDTIKRLFVNIKAGTHYVCLIDNDNTLFTRACYSHDNMMYVYHLYADMLILKEPSKDKFIEEVLKDGFL